MDSKAKRLAALVLELRGGLSQRQFAKKLGVSFSAVQSWEVGTSWPGTQNLTRIAQLKGWSFDELQHYLEGETLSPRLSVNQLLAEVRSLPFESAVQVARVALETMAIKGEAKAS
ncbi:helix-turn-helix domain-containing protein [Coleofasciculus sp.]|uniref:helix-turn-helix domain-containing protein n=1 Tax=Coleofasciculus sp. TaxID=3100458 RepID=UPI0039F7F61E